MYFTPPARLNSSSRAAHYYLSLSTPQRGDAGKEAPLELGERGGDVGIGVALLRAAIRARRGGHCATGANLRVELRHGTTRDGYRRGDREQNEARAK